MRLEVENMSLLAGPSLDQVLSALDRLKPEGPSFAILEDATGRFVQTNGGNDVMTVEWREQSGGGFRHWVAGRMGDAQSPAQIPTRGGPVVVRQNELLTLSDAKALFTAFYQGQPRPRAYEWRETTDQFAGTFFEQEWTADFEAPRLEEFFARLSQQAPAFTRQQAEEILNQAHALENGKLTIVEHALDWEGSPVRFRTRVFRHDGDCFDVGIVTTRPLVDMLREVHREMRRE